MTIEYHYETTFELDRKEKYTEWIILISQNEQSVIGQLNYIFCDDAYLANINLNYLNHDSFTDIITFDYSKGAELSGDIFISIERVMDNSKTFETTFENELKRVMAHGILHLVGYNDKTKEEQKVMRDKEDKAIKLFHVER